jgi:alkyldihydroxyacetonephosphate synthase
LRDALATLGLVVETFETAITWDRFNSFHANVMEATRTSAERIAGAAIVTCRLTHVYPDGAAPYFTVIARGRPRSQVAMWDEIKAAASEAILAGGGTITHHHAVGRDHRPFYDRERPELFGVALRAAKAALDPNGIMNPGALLG